MENKPRGREKKVSGTGKSITRRGKGLDSGSVGNTEIHEEQRKDLLKKHRDQKEAADEDEDGAVKFENGIRNIIRHRRFSVLAVVMTAILIFGSVLLSGCGNADSNQSSNTVKGFPYGSFGSVSSGWITDANVGKLNNSVAAGSRDKFTEIKGNGKDTVTIMIYMCGTDLESQNAMATSDLNEMLSADISDKVNVLVYTGGCKKWRNNVISSSKNQIYKLNNDGITCLVKDDGSASMTKSSTLTRFIQYCTANYPANRNELIFWDHGGGSLSGYGYDEKHPNSGSMTLQAISEAVASAEMTFDFIGFDTCLMATLENAFILAPYADYFIASEETEPGVGWYYTNWLTELSKNTSMPTLQIGKKIIDDFVAACNKQCYGQQTTLSMVDLAELQKTVPEALKNFSVDTVDMMQSNEYKQISNARSKAREFASSCRLDQVDLVNLALNLGTDAGNDLAKSLLGAIKYNKTSNNMTNAYGLSIYFPYKNSGSVDSAVATYDAIGLDSEYTRCIQKFASMEVGGQAVSGGQSSPLGSLFGLGQSGSSSVDTDMILQVLVGLLGGRMADVSGLTEDNSEFIGRSMNENDVDSVAQYLADNYFDSSALVWSENNGSTEMKLSEEQWGLVQDLELNVFFDDGEGYIDLGLDNVFDISDDGALKGEYDGTWLAINDQPVAYYHTNTVDDGSDYSITGRVPVLLNGERADLILVFDNDNPDGFVAGVRYDYQNDETDTIAKVLPTLTEGDTIDFVCDYYTYDGEYENSYLIGEQLVYDGNDLVISNVEIDADAAAAAYMFTDIYCQNYWTPLIP